MFDRIKYKKHKERLGFNANGPISKGAIKKAYHKLALIWHPDNLNKKHKYCFANKEAYTKMMSDIF